MQTSSAAASAELGDASAALHARLAELRAAQEATAERSAAISSRTDKLEMLVGVVETNRDEAVQAVASVRTAIATVLPRPPRPQLYSCSSYGVPRAGLRIAC